MAFTNFIPGIRVTLNQDAESFRVFDDSIWNGESGLTTDAWVIVTHIDDENNAIVYDAYSLFQNGSAEFLEYLATSGHQVNIADLTIDGVAAGVKFPDGLYTVSVHYTDGSYPNTQEPEKTITTGFLAKYRCMKRTMPALLLSWPITDAVRRKNDDIYTLGLYFDAAEYAASQEQYVLFHQYVELMRKIVDHYAIPEPW